MRAKLHAWLRRVLGYVLLAACVAGAASMLTWSAADPSFTRATDAPARNLLGPIGAIFADLAIRLFGLAGVAIILPPTFWALQLITRRRLDGVRLKLALAPVAVLLLAGAASSLPRVATWPVPFGLGGFLGDQVLRGLCGLMAVLGPERVTPAAGLVGFSCGMIVLMASLGLSPGDLKVIWQDRRRSRSQFMARAWRSLGGIFERTGAPGRIRREPTLDMPQRPSGVDRIAAWRAGPSLDRDARLASDSFASDDGARFSEPARGREFDGATDTECHAMARRFAPEPAEPDTEAFGFSLRGGLRSGFDRSPDPRSAPDPGRDGERIGKPAGWRSRFPRPPAFRKGKTGQRPIWPGSVPIPAARDAPPEDQRQPRRVAADVLYRRAVAIVRADRKASTDCLQQRLGIGYMRAADLIDRMEQEGILGAPVRNGVRPILSRMPRSRVV